MKMRLMPISRAMATMGSTPFTGRSLPFRDNSPINIESASILVCICSVAVRIPIAMGRSYCEPSLRRSAGARLTTVFFAWSLKPEFSKAAWMRSWLSLMVLSGRPTMNSPMPPEATFTSAVTATASMPEIAPVCTLTNI